MTRLTRLHRGVALLGALMSASAAGATEPCGLCDQKVVTNPALAACFLEAYPSLAGKTEGAVVVDLSACEQSRGIVDALRLPGSGPLEPDVEFILTPEQLGCLKAKLEQPDLALDPTATIELDSCE
ncbi:MAG: hypothetical protein KJ796_19255 [Alphaproteobacteria bacterium]|nr:hypothetical protein [Alphaproteobacteria bacterium]